MDRLLPQDPFVGPPLPKASNIKWPWVEGQELKERVLLTLEQPSTKIVSGPLISVIVPAYQEELILPQLIESLKNQNYQNYELIVADSGNDKTSQIARNAGAKAVKVPYGNISAARNAGARQANGSVLFFLDADCILAHDTLQLLLDELQKAGVVLAWGRNCYYEDGVYPTLRAIESKFHPPWQTVRGVMIRKDDFWEIGGYDENCKPIEGCREDIKLGEDVGKHFGFGSVKLVQKAPVGTSMRREKEFGFGWTWEKTAGVRNGEVLERR